MTDRQQPQKRIYLDWAAATPISPAVQVAMEPFFGVDFGNPGAIHAEGRLARQAVNEAREKVATTLGIKPAGVIFTGSGTESNNLAIIGHIEYLHQVKALPYQAMEIVTTAIEHPSITATVKYLSNLGVGIKIVPVDQFGLINPTALEKSLTPQTVLVIFAYANSEVGTIQPVHKLVRKVQQYNRTNQLHIQVHLDGAQAPLWLPCQLPRLGVDTLALDAGKCGGPKGVGILAGGSLTNLRPLQFGGGQEANLRPGTENVAGIVGGALALELAQSDHEDRAERVSMVRDAGLALLKEALPIISHNGAEGKERLANNINISLPPYDTEYAVTYLDQHGVAASTKSACAGGGGGESVVVKTLYHDPARARSTLRLALGPDTTVADLAYVAKVLQQFTTKIQTLTR